MDFPRSRNESSSGERKKIQSDKKSDFTVIFASPLEEAFRRQNNSCSLVPIIINSRSVRAITQSVATISFMENRAKYNFCQFINYARADANEGAVGAVTRFNDF